MAGWIKLHRKISHGDLWLSEKFTRGQAWVDMLMLANHTDGFIRSNGLKIQVKRGQIGWSELKLAERWKWSRGKVRRFFSELEEEKMIVQQKNRRSPLISLVNYKQHQQDGTTDSTTDSTTNGQETDKRRYTKKNDKKEENDKKVIEGDKSPKPKSKTGKRISEDWVLSQKNIDHGKSKGYSDEQITELSEQFLNHWLQATGKGSTSLDWGRQWIKWLGNDTKWNGDPLHRNNGNGNPGNGKSKPSGLARATSELAAEIRARDNEQQTDSISSDGGYGQSLGAIIENDEIEF